MAEGASRYTAGAGMSEPGRPQAREEAPAKSDAAVRIGGAASSIRIQNIPDDVKDNASPSREASGPSTGLSSSGTPVPMSRLKPGDSIVHGELGRMEVRVLEHMGLLVKSTEGGYKFPSDFSDPAPQKGETPAPETTQEAGETDAGKDEAGEGDDAPLADADKASFSRGIEMVIDSALKKAGEQSVIAMTEALVSNRPDALAKMLPEYESVMGMEAGEGAETIAALVKEAKDKGRSLGVAVGLEPSEYDAAEAWLLANHPKEAEAANRAFFDKGDTRPAQKLLAKFAANDAARYGISDHTAWAGQVGDGVRVFQSDDGLTMVEAQGDTMRLSEAIPQGIVNVSRAR
jgi:hypothetical protein